MAPRLKVQPEVGVALGAGRLVSRPRLAAPPGLQALNPTPRPPAGRAGSRKGDGPRLLPTGPTSVLLRACSCHSQGFAPRRGAGVGSLGGCVFFF